LLLIARDLADLWIPLSVPFIYAAILCLIATSIRFLMRAIGRSLNSTTRHNVVIYGAGAAGSQLMHALKSNPNYRICQFIDDNEKLHGRTISGISIGSFDKTKARFKALEIRTIILAMSNISNLTRQRISGLLAEHLLHVKTIHSITRSVSGISDITELPDIDIEDLLGRSPVQPDTKLMSKSVTGKTVLVTGAGGSIGSELCRQIIQWSPTELILLDISEFSIYTLSNELNARVSGSEIKITPLVGSVQDNHFVKMSMSRFTIDTIYHAAAYKHVHLMELNVMQCVSNNVFGTYNVAQNAIAAKVPNFILISTDKAVNPTNFMGASKRFAEIFCQSLNQKQSETCFSIVRFGNVLGSSGSVVPLFKQQIRKKESITLTHLDVTRYFMTIPEAAQLVIQAGAIAKGGEIFVLDMGKPVKILDLAKKMITLSGLTPVLGDEKTPNADEIPILIIGLRPGEKLYEELSHSPNLNGTVHPRIMTTTEEVVALDDIKVFLTEARAAINDCDHKKLCKIIASVTGGVSDSGSSMDTFITPNAVHSKTTVTF
jgi:FlaA1/EpsC-like NDP-sugar epimerase